MEIIRNLSYSLNEEEIEKLRQAEKVLRDICYALDCEDCAYCPMYNNCYNDISNTIDKVIENNEKNLFNHKQ